jgi:hypothetical protein
MGKGRQYHTSTGKVASTTPVPTIDAPCSASTKSGPIAAGPRPRVDQVGELVKGGRYHTSTELGGPIAAGPRPGVDQVSELVKVAGTTPVPSLVARSSAPRRSLVADCARARWEGHRAVIRSCSLGQRSPVPHQYRRSMRRARRSTKSARSLLRGPRPGVDQVGELVGRYHTSTGLGARPSGGLAARRRRARSRPSGRSAAAAIAVKQIRSSWGKVAGQGRASRSLLRSGLMGQARQYHTSTDVRRRRCAVLGASTAAATKSAIAAATESAAKAPRQDRQYHTSTGRSSGPAPVSVRTMRRAQCSTKRRSEPWSSIPHYYHPDRPGTRPVPNQYRIWIAVFR